MPANPAELTLLREPGGSRKRLPSWVATTALLVPTYGWLTLAVFLPLCAMFAFSFLTATPMGNAPIVFTLKQYRAFIAWSSLQMKKRKGITSRYIWNAVGW